METNKLKSIVESLLFMSGEPIKVSRLAKIAGVSRSEVENAVRILQEEYNDGRGLNFFRKDDEVQMVTNPENSEYVSAMIKSEIQENLSKSALEVLSIIAYRGPITRIDIEAIRGINSTFTLRSLLMRGLVEREENPKDNRGYLYKISFEFMKKLGIDSPEKLPDWENLSKDSRIDNIIPN